ncbi:uncharacterized protein LOC116431346 isoform X1 [Nomia melanderi]|uniref:uncharacterized protein LOC116431346 isoform X1 n=3 Tax=Nomia melanderi TaxID=2448451 RepID=UPI003FCEDAB4
MSLEWYHATLAALMIWICCLDSSVAGPFPEHVMVLPSRKFLKSSAVTTTSIIAKRNDVETNDDRSTGSNHKLPVSNSVNMYRLPPSPANLLKPDGFQFYTYNERGDMITKQMTPEEIQALIASGGPDHSSTGVQEPQKVEDILTGGKKVMDVVEKVQNVLKSAMNKPSTLTGTIPNSVPEKANVEWTNILPVILAGEKHGDTPDDTRYVERFTVTSTDRTSTARIDFSSDTFELNATALPSTELLDNGTTTFADRNEEPTHSRKNGTQLLSTIASDTGTSSPYTEKIMIPVAVITAEQKPQNVDSTTQSLVFQKITEIMPSGDATKENYNGNNNRLTLNVYVDRDGATETFNATTTVAYSPTVQIEATTVSTNGPQLEEKLNTATGQVSPITSSKIDTLGGNESYTTTPVALDPSEASETSATSSDPAVIGSFLEREQSSGNESDYAATKSNHSDTVSSPTSLPIELINSLSSMMDQVSEVSASSILSLSSDFERESPDAVVEEKKENSASRTSAATTTSTTTTTKFSTIVGDAFDEQIEESVSATTAKLQVDQDRVTWTIPPVTWSKLFASTHRTPTEATLNFTRTSTTFPDENVTTNFTSFSRTGTTLTPTATDSILAFASSGETHAAVPVSVTLRPNNGTTTAKPLVDSANANSTSFGTLLKESDPEQHSNIESLALIETILGTVSTEANIPSTRPLTLPNIPAENLPPKTLASGLIAGFGSIDSNGTENRETTSDAANLAPTNVTPTIDSKVASKLETQTVPSVTETSSNTTAWYTEEGDATNENETRSSLAANQNSYGELTRPPNLVGERETTDRTISSTRANVEYIKAEKENETPSTDSPVFDVVTTANLAANNSEISFSEDVNSTTMVIDKLSSASSDGNNPMQEMAWHADGTTETSITSKFEGTPVEAFKKDDVTNWDGLGRNSSTEYTTLASTHGMAIMSTLSSMGTDVGASSLASTAVVGTLTATTSTPITTAAAAAAVTATASTINGSMSSTNKETKDFSNTVLDTNSIATESNKVVASVNVTETTITTNEYDQSGGIIGIESKSKSNVTHNLSMNRTNELTLKHSNSDKRNTTDDGNSDGKWQRITLHESVTTSSTKAVPVTKETSKVSESAATSTTTSIPTTTSSIRHGNSTKEETPYQTTPVNESGTMVTLNPSKNTGGLDSSTKNASNDIVNFSRLCNQLAFQFWTAANKGLSTGRSLALSPFGMISLLAMLFLGARGSTSDQMNGVLGLDNVATFNPHLIFQNVTDAVSLARHQGIANAAFVRELFADKVKVRKLLPFYKEQAQQFYEGLVAEVNFATISDLARRRTNLLIRKQTGGRIRDFVKSNAVPLRSPLAAISANVFQTDCNTSSASATGRDGELYFATSSAHRLRKLIPVPATVWRSNVLAGYEPSLDATAIGLGGVGKLVSTIFLLPGQQGHTAPGDTLDRLEQRLVKGAFRDDSWQKLLKVLIPRRGLELQVPKFSHRSVVNATAALKRMGLDQLFTNDADFKGINGIGNRLFLSDVLQMNLFSTCGDENTANGRHHVEIYPASPLSRNSPIYDDAHRTTDVQEHLVSDFRARNSETQPEDRPRLKLDQPFLYFVRHNPTGLILHMGRFNPRLI